jgi:hypothetical protein
MRLPRLSLRHTLLLGLAALIVFCGALSILVTPEQVLDRDALARLSAEVAEEPVTTGSVDER